MVGASLILGRLRAAVLKFESVFLSAISGRPFPPPAICTDLISTPVNDGGCSEKFSLKELLGDGFLYAVPKSRRTLEKRMNRKFGFPDLHSKLIVPKGNIRTCYVCGHDYELNKLCRHCYEKVKEETTQMQEKIKEDIGLNPIEQDVIVLYENEKLDEPEEFWKGKRVIEMKKPRPSWFSRNLMQKTTQLPATSTEVKPIDHE